MSQIGPEKIAALLDGRLRGDEREAAIAALLSSPELMQDCADTIAVLHASEEADLPSDRHRPVALSRWFLRHRPLVSGLAAALILTVSATYLYFSRPGLPGAIAFVAAIESPSRATPLPEAPWSVTRGGEGVQLSTSSAIRVGARLVDLGILIRQGNDSSARYVALELANRVSELPAGGGASVALRQLASSGNTAERRDAYVGAARMTTMLAGEETVQVGAWLQAARIAARAQQVSFFSWRHSKAALVALERVTEDSPLASRALSSVRALVTAEHLDWLEIEVALTELQLRLGSPGDQR